MEDEPQFDSWLEMHDTLADRVSAEGNKELEEAFVNLGVTLPLDEDSEANAVLVVVGAMWRNTLSTMLKNAREEDNMEVRRFALTAATFSSTILHSIEDAALGRWKG